MSNFDENKACRSLSQVCKIDSRSKWIEVSRGTMVGLRRLAKIDFLVNKCGYKLSYGGRVAVGDKFDVSDDAKSKYAKKDSKSHKLTDKRKR